MSQYLPLSARNVEFILELFDAGSTLHQILNALYSSGQVDVQFITIQRCLREHGRLLPPFPDPSDSSNHTSLSHPQPSSGATSSAPIYNWNVQADNHAILAHRYGKTVSEITTQLRNNGYVRVTAEEVMASLLKQGAKNVT